jgi:hypothetical protein
VVLALAWLLDVVAAGGVVGLGKHVLCVNLLLDDE